MLGLGLRQSETGHSQACQLTICTHLYTAYNYGQTQQNSSCQDFVIEGSGLIAVPKDQKDHSRPSRQDLCPKTGFLI